VVDQSAEQDRLIKDNTISRAIDTITSNRISNTLNVSNTIEG